MPSVNLQSPLPSSQPLRFAELPPAVEEFRSLFEISQLSPTTFDTQFFEERDRRIATRMAAKKGVLDGENSVMFLLF
jgi:hypothetical protein